jgi:hypothetical protein
MLLAQYCTVTETVERACSKGWHEIAALVVIVCTAYHYWRLKVLVGTP